MGDTSAKISIPILKVLDTWISNTFLKIEILISMITRLFTLKLSRKMILNSYLFKTFKQNYGLRWRDTEIISNKCVLRFYMKSQVNI